MDCCDSGYLKRVENPASNFSLKSGDKVMLSMKKKLIKPSTYASLMISALGRWQMAQKIE